MDNNNNSVLQESFLHQLQKEQTPVSIFLVNGIKLHGVIDAFDASAILLKSSTTQMVYKHAISTVVPAKLDTMTVEKRDKMHHAA